MACRSADAKRPNRTAAARREQYERAEARRIGHMLKAFVAVSTHRGCENSRLGVALQHLLSGADVASKSDGTKESKQRAACTAELEAAWQAGWMAHMRWASAVSPSVAHHGANAQLHAQEGEDGSRVYFGGAAEAAACTAAATGAEDTKAGADGAAATPLAPGTTGAAAGTGACEAAGGLAEELAKQKLPLQLKTYRVLRPAGTSASPARAELFCSQEQRASTERELHATHRASQPHWWCRLCKDELARTAASRFGIALEDARQLPFHELTDMLGCDARRLETAG